MKYLCLAFLYEFAIMSDSIKEISKFLSFVLRHSPHTLQLQLDEHGWASVEELIEVGFKKGYESLLYP